LKAYFTGRVPALHFCDRVLACSAAAVCEVYADPVVATAANLLCCDRHVLRTDLSPHPRTHEVLEAKVNQALECQESRRFMVGLIY
jgi:hypothetical protein